MTKTLRFVKQSGAIYRVLLETPAGCWLIDCNGPSPPFFEVSLDRYERVPAPNSWMDEHTITPAQEVRLRMIQPMMDCDDCISDKTLRYKMAAEAAQQHQTTTRRILRLYYRYLATGQVTTRREPRKRTQNNQAIERAIRRYYFGAKRLSLLYLDRPLSQLTHCWRGSCPTRRQVWYTVKMIWPQRWAYSPGNWTLWRQNII